MISLSRPIRCSLDEVPDYVSGHLSSQRASAWDRHLITCVGCQRAVAEERRLQALLSSGCPSMPGSLHAQLVALASSMTGPAMAQASERAPLEMVAPSAPPVHRSPLRSAALATAAAGATAAVAWTLTITGTGSMSSVASVTPSGKASPTARPSTGAASAGVGSGLGTFMARPVSVSWIAQPSIRGLKVCEAESTA